MRKLALPLLTFRVLKFFSFVGSLVSWLYIVLCLTIFSECFYLLKFVASAKKLAKQSTFAHSQWIVVLNAFAKVLLVILFNLEVRN